MSTINGVNLLNVTSGSNTQAATAATTPAAGATTAGIGTNVASPAIAGSAITTQSTQLQAIKASLDIGAPIDLLKVSSLKSAIDAGTYVPDASQIANGLIASATGFLSPGLRITHWCFFEGLLDAVSLTSTLVQGVNSVQAEIATVQNELATGVKTMNPAQKGIVTRLSSQVAIYSSDAANITQASSVINVGQTSLNNLSTIISQMQQLATQAASGGLSTTDLASLNTTFTALASQISAAIQNATVNGNNFLYNSPTGTYGSTTNGTITIQIGLDTTGTATIVGQGLDTTLAMLVTGLSISSQTGANSAITALASGLTSVSTAQSNLNAFSTAMASDLASVTSLGANLTTTINSLQAVDQTAAQAELQQLNNQQSVDYYLVSQMNTEAAAILTLFR
eukprot:gene24464-26269_t